MSKPKVKTLPDLSLTSSKHQETIEKGDFQFYSWQ
jgi:hypothetical protein